MSPSSGYSSLIFLQWFTIEKIKIIRSRSSSSSSHYSSLLSYTRTEKKMKAIKSAQGADARFPKSTERKYAIARNHIVYTKKSSSMETSDKCVSPKEVEMIQKVETPAKTKDKRLQVVVEITFCTHVGWDGILVMVLTLGIAGLFVYITFLYTKGFQTWHRPGVWIFFGICVALCITGDEVFV